MPHGLRGCPRVLGCPRALGLPLGLVGRAWGRGVAPGQGDTPKFGYPPQKQIWLELATYGYVWGIDQWILHGFSIRNFDIFYPGPHFWSPNPTSWPRKARGPFGAQKGDPKNITLWRVWSSTRFPWFVLRGEWFVWYPGTFWVYQFPPEPSQKMVLQGFSPNLKIPGGPP